MPPRENRLAKQASAYLRTAAHQPIHWHAWGAEAFAQAQVEEKPILLDVGAVWCHWCHVMDHESYEDADLARFINERFVAIKVDRDERPDVDARYQKAVQAMTGQGGWPLTAFLLPDGRTFYGGTYFPPKDHHGRPSFRRVLEAISDAYRQARHDLVENAEKIAQHLAAARPTGGRAAVTDELGARAVGAMRQLYDPVNAGFGQAPKFPHPAAHDLLLQRAARGDAVARDLAVSTLERMRAGGIYDQVAGGFHRYSVDARWIVPHFEKMLYDNAGLLRNYSRAARLSGRGGFEATAREIMAFLRNVLGAGGPGFGGSQDADVGPGDDGDHFTWTLDELTRAVGDEGLARLLAAHFDVGPVGEMHHDPARNVLHVAADAEALAAAFHRPVDEVRAALADGIARLAAARAQRKAPFVDPIRYTAWNAMAIQALLEHAGAFEDAEADRLALDALDLFLVQAYDPARGFARGIGLDVHGLLDDNAQMLDALLEAHLATGEARYLDVARATGEFILAHFRHPAGAFADRAEAIAGGADAAPLRDPERPTQDAPTASANGAALLGLLRLAEATGDDRYHQEAVDALEALAPEADRLHLFGGAVLLAMDRALHPAPRVVLTGRAAASADAYRRVVRREGPPGAVLLGPTDGGAARLPSGLPRDGAVVCFGTRCLAPAFSAVELSARLAPAK